VACDIGNTVDWIKKNMSAAELESWRAFYLLQQKQTEEVEKHDFVKDFNG
jgi:hypothetical protein